MQKILGKRIFRQFKSNFVKYMALGLMTALGMYLVISLAGAAETIINGVNKASAENMVEDGEFTMLQPLTRKQEEELRNSRITLERNFHVDYRLSDQSVVRIFVNRTQINKAALDNGTHALDIGEGVLEKRYSQEHGVQLGDEIYVGGGNIRIVGIGSVPDYDGVFRNLSDPSADSRQFGLLFVTQAQYDELIQNDKDVMVEEYTYSYLLNNELTHMELRQLVMDCAEDGENSIPNQLMLFLKSEDNPRIKASAEDQVINRAAGLIAGIIVMLLFAYVISVFVIHNIESQSCVIGGLYALGVRKRDLILHYLILPVMVALLGGCLGTWLGFGRLGVSVQMESCYGYFSMPRLSVLYPPYLIVYGLLMPAAAAGAVNLIVIYGKLRQPALRLLRNERKSSRVKHIQLGNMGFMARFQLRHMIREIRTGITVIIGLFIALLVMMMGADCLVMCVRVIGDYKEDARFQMMYSYKFPEETVPEGGEACYMETLSCDIYGNKLDVTILGIDDHNPYFPFTPVTDKGRLTLSSAAARKFNLKAGDKIVLKDKGGSQGQGDLEHEYEFTVEGIEEYSIGLYAFMDINSMRDVFNKNTDYYNVVYADGKLDAEMSKVYGITEKQDIVKSSYVFLDLMMPLISMLLAVSVMIFVVVMYLMMKVMIDRSSFGVSLVKIFGYRMKEIRKLYLRGNMYVVAIGGAVCIPAAKLVMDQIFPLMISNVACGADISFEWWMYGAIYGAVLILAAAINMLLVKRLKSISLAAVLKNRE